jgi:hypothetical protein
MKVQLNQELLDVEGKSISSGKAPKLFLKDVCINAVLTPFQEDKEEDKWKKYELYKKLRDVKGEVELKVEEVSMIKKAIGKVNTTLVMGQAWEMLEGK